MNHETTRRRFLSGLAVSALSAGTVGCGSLVATEGSAGIVDTHTHFYDPTRPQGVPWPGRDDAFLYRPVLPPEFETLARPLGVTSTVVVEASAWEDDNAWVLGLADRHRSLIGMVGHLNPGEPGFPTALTRFQGDRRFRGIRIGGGQVVRALDDEGLRRDLARLAESGLAVDVLVGPEQLEAVARMAGALPNLTVVIDHCANVRVDGKAPPAAWVDAVRRCAGHAQVVMKVSGLVEGTGRSRGDAPGDVAFYRPVLDVVYEAFGPDRVVYGSNWPVSARFASYETVFRIVETYFRAKGSTVADRYFTRNALRVYGVSVSGTGTAGRRPGRV